MSQIPCLCCLLLRTGGGKKLIEDGVPRQCLMQLQLLSLARRIASLEMVCGFDLIRGFAPASGLEARVEVKESTVHTGCR